MGGKELHELCSSLGNPGCVYQLLGSISVSRDESQNGNSLGMIGFVLCAAAWTF